MYFSLCNFFVSVLGINQGPGSLNTDIITAFASGGLLCHVPVPPFNQGDHRQGAQVQEGVDSVYNTVRWHSCPHDWVVALAGLLRSTSLACLRSLWTREIESEILSLSRFASIVLTLCLWTAEDLSLFSALESQTKNFMMVWSPILFWNLTELPLSLSPTKLVCVLLNFRPRHPLHQSYPLWRLCSKRLRTMLLWKACQIEFPHQATRISNVSMIIIMSPPMTLQQVLATDQDQRQQQAWKRIQRPVFFFAHFVNQFP